MPGSRRRQRGVLLAGIALLLAALVLAVVLASVFMPGREAAGGQPLRWQDRGTTRSLREIVLGRCYSYLAERRPALGSCRIPMLVRHGHWHALQFRPSNSQRQFWLREGFDLKLLRVLFPRKTGSLFWLPLTILKLHFSRSTHLNCQGW